MEANKVTLTVEVNVLDIEAAPDLLTNVINHIRAEYHNGKLTAKDGDNVTWKTETKAIQI